MGKLPTAPPRSLATSCSTSLLSICLALSPVLVGGCGSGVTDAEIRDLQADIAATFKKRDQTVTEMFLTRDSAYQVSGMIYVRVDSVTGGRVFYTPCLATMDPQTRHFNWKCESVP
jgi:hypothetical protein